MYRHWWVGSCCDRNNWYSAMHRRFQTPTMAHRVVTQQNSCYRHFEDGFVWRNMLAWSLDIVLFWQICNYCLVPPEMNICKLRMPNSTRCRASIPNPPKQDFSQSFITHFIMPTFSDRRHDDGVLFCRAMKAKDRK
jgi:hypothetical protein